MNISLDYYDFIFMILTIAWLMEFIIFPSNKRSNEVRKFSYYLILFSIISIALLNGIFLFLKLGVFHITAVKIVALITYFIGLVLRYWSLIMLGNNFSRNVEVEKNQQLISTGPYKYLRHPLYLGLFLLAISVPLYSGNFILFMFSIFLMHKILRIRMKEEELIMERVIGDRYIDWKNERYRFVPFIY